MVGLSDYDDLTDYYNDDGNEEYDDSFETVFSSTTASPVGLGIYRKSAIKLGKLVLEKFKDELKT
jgi:hypothetical protein